MKHPARIALICSLALLTSCASVERAGIGGFVKAVTTTVANPVDAVDIYRTKTVYASTLEGAAAWRAYCWSKSYAALMRDPIAAPICRNRRPNLRAMQAAEEKAFSMITKAEAFVANNPTLNAANVLAGAWQAVVVYQNVVSVKTTMAAK